MYYDYVEANVVIYVGLLYKTNFLADSLVCTVFSSDNLFVLVIYIC